MRTSRKIREAKKSVISVYFNEELQSFKEKTKYPLIFIITYRTVLLLSLYLAATEIFYVIGNYQSFTDSDLNLILNVMAIVSSGLIIFSIFGIFLAIFLFVLELKKQFRLSYLVHLVLFALSSVFGTACLLEIMAIGLLSKGIGL